MNQQKKQIRKLTVVFIVILFLSGLTAIPVDSELTFLLRYIPAGDLHSWLEKVLNAYRSTDTQYPFLLYGYDWLAFAHFILAVLFIGVYRNPVKNIWVTEFGMIASALIIPFAFAAGSFRQIPVEWRLIDSSFGIFGLLLLGIIYRKTKTLEKTQKVIKV